MNSARENILKRLAQNRFNEIPVVLPYIPSYAWTQEQKIEKFTQHMQAVHGQVYRVKKTDWISCLKQLLVDKSIMQLLFSQQTEIGQEIVQVGLDGVSMLEYEQPIEAWKDDFFDQITAGLTTTCGAIAETGSLILWPTVQEPRLVSLLPPIHIAVLEAENLSDTFAQALHQQHWSETMPSNALLISGPSKTADIEQVLAYGVHGPKQLIVIIRE